MSYICFVIILNGKIHNYVRKQELSISRMFNTRGGLRQSPHITIKFPFETDNLESLERYFDELVETVEPFEIEIDGIDYFEPKVIFLNVCPNKNISALHFKVLKDLREQFSIQSHELEGKNVRFHITLAYKDLTEEDFCESKKFLKNEHPYFRLIFNTLGLFYYLKENDSWIIYKRAKLKKAKSST